MFPGPTLLAAVGATVEAALNRTLALDPAGRQALMTALTGPVEFRVTAPVAMSWTLIRIGDRVQVHSQPDPGPALVIAGHPMAFVAMATGDPQVIPSGRLRIQGDTALAHRFQQAVEQLNPDWEAALAQHIGDVPAHFIGQRLRGALAWSRQAIAAMNANVEEYIHEESQTLPGRRELEATFRQIDDLHLSVERLEARLNQLLNAAPNPTTEHP